MRSRHRLRLMELILSIILVGVASYKRKEKKLDDEAFNLDDFDEVSRPLDYRDILGHGGSKATGVIVHADNVYEIGQWVTAAFGEAESIVEERHFGRTYVSNSRVRVKVPGKGWRVAQQGDIVAMAKDGTCFVIKKEDFDNYVSI